MATIVNNPPPQYRVRSSGYGFLLGVLLFIIFAVLLIYYGLPLLSSAARAPQIQIPSQINVNVHSSQ